MRKKVSILRKAASVRELPTNFEHEDGGFFLLEGIEHADEGSNRLFGISAYLG